MRIAVISDTHDLLRTEVLEQISISDAVIHAGDFSSRRILDEIRQEMKDPNRFFCVRGNNDKDWAEGIPVQLHFELEGIGFFLVHNKKEIPSELKDTQIVIFGHSHKYLEREENGRLWLNPGSCGKRRFRQEISMAVLEAEHGSWNVKKILIPPAEKNGDEPEIPSKDMSELINQILKRMQKRQTVERIASDLKVKPEFVEEIMRIQVTHPGVTVNGILSKMEANRSIEVFSSQKGKSML